MASPFQQSCVDRVRNELASNGEAREAIEKGYDCEDVFGNFQLQMIVIRILD